MADRAASQNSREEGPSRRSRLALFIRERRDHREILRDHEKTDREVVLDESRVPADDRRRRENAKRAKGAKGVRTPAKKSVNQAQEGGEESENDERGRDLRIQ